jgi:excinuclease UvrABC nuclease subunit
MDLPNTSGVYRIEMNDGRTYAGKATDIHNRLHGAFSSGGALNEEGYTANQVKSLDWIEMPGASDDELYSAEADWIKYEGGIENLANRVNSPGAP